MKFFFDESGSFRVPENRQEHAVGIVVGVVVPEVLEIDLWRRFHEFKGKLPASASKNGEVKGYLLDEVARRAFAIMVSEFEAIQIRPTILDLSSIAGKSTERRDRLVAKLKATALQCTHETLQQEVGTLARQAGNLSPEQAFRLRAWAQSIYDCVYDSIVWHSGPEFLSCWDTMRFEIDAVQPKEGSREEQVFSKLLPGWLTRQSEKDPFMLIEEVHTENHPFVRNWETERGIDLGKMFRGNVQFCSSHLSPGLQVADIAASLVRKAVVGIVSAYDLKTYGMMMSTSPRSDTHAHGIITFGEMNQVDHARYSGLVDALSAARS